MIRGMMEIANHYGLTSQSRQLVEEMAELTQAICKMHRYGSSYYNRDNIIEEIADVEIMLYQVKILMDCPIEVTEMKKEKIARQLARIEHEREVQEIQDT